MQNDNKILYYIPYHKKMRNFKFVLPSYINLSHLLLTVQLKKLILHIHSNRSFSLVETIILKAVDFICSLGNRVVCNRIWHLTHITTHRINYSQHTDVVVVVVVVFFLAGDDFGRMFHQFIPRQRFFFFFSSRSGD